MIYHLENEHGITKKNPMGNSFKSFMEVALPEFKVLSDNKARRMIINTYTQSTKQLTELLQDTYS
ncbi:4521_t:CDS:2, partial [Gigaspora margarita]